MVHSRKPVLLVCVSVCFLLARGIAAEAQQQLRPLQGPRGFEYNVDPSSVSTNVAIPANVVPVPEIVSQYDARRIDAARRSADQYRAREVTLPPLARELASTNADLADQWADLAEKYNALAVRTGDAKLRLHTATQDFDDVKASLQQQGLTPTIGLLLSHKQSQLEDWQVDGATSYDVNDEIQRSRAMQAKHAMLTYNGSDAARQAAEILSRAGYQAGQADYGVVAGQVQSLLRERSVWLQLLGQGYNDYRQQLSEFDATSTSFSKLTQEYRRFINRHVTWIRNIEPLGVADFRNFRSGLGFLFNARRSEEIGYGVSQKWKSDPASCLTLLGWLVVLFLGRVLAKYWLVGIGKRTRLREATASTRKCVASLLTPAVAIAYPSMLFLTARWLGSGYVSEATLHVSSGLYAASLAALIVEVPRQLLRSNGFIERHQKIELPRRLRASAYLLVIGTGLVLMAYVVTLSAHIDRGVWRGSLARLGAIAALVVVAWTAHLALKPRGGFLEPLVERFGGSLLYRLRWLIYGLAVGFPFAMIGLLTLGYEFAANEIILRAGLMLSGLLIAATLWAALKIIASAIWQIITGTRQERRFDAYGEIQPVRTGGALADHALELKHQLAFLGQCGLVLAGLVGLGWLWIDILPSVQMGNPVVWTVQETINQALRDANGQEIFRAEVRSAPVTVLHLVLALATLFVAFQLAKLLPALFDVLVLQRVSFDEAMEHLTLVLGRCLLFGGGCFVACRLIGVRWDAIQWLAVGLLIGVGFGLQDLLRNLLGGLIVLFEKPARLGDLITVGNFTGRVASQKLRTTVLTDDQGREVIIPNQNFVKQDVVNWMGAGRLQVIPIEVAVTRDERPADICRKLQQLLAEQPELLLAPAPQATLVCVSQKWQRIELRGWIEEGLDPQRCRTAITETVLKFLAEKNLLAPTQPRQPSLDESLSPSAGANFRPRNKRTA